MDGNGLIAVTGATGRQGGAVVRHLLADGWQVRALTRDPGSAPARQLAQLGAEVVACDMMQPPTLERAFQDAHGVYSVQNPMISGFDDEVSQGMNVVDAAREAGVRHVVYGAAGTGEPGTGVGSWESKILVAEHARERDVPITVLRPMAFMELMTHKGFYPPVAAWHLMPRLVGPDRPISWLSVDDLGAIATRAFADPQAFIGADLALASDQRTLSECREIWRRVVGRGPRSFPMPVWMFERFVGDDLTTMWRWLAEHDVEVDPADTRALLPAATTVEEWLARRVAGR